MSQSRLKRFGRRLRVGFRAFRYVVWMLLIAVLLAVLYVNRIGLPGFAKQRVLEQLRSHGVELEFRRLRVRFDHGLVAEEVVFKRLESLPGPEASAQAVQLELDWKALRSGKFRVAGLRIRDGQMRWVLVETNREPQQLSLDHLQVELMFRTNDVWQLANLEAQFAGARVKFNGAITNASAWKEWRAGRAPRSAVDSAERLRARLFTFADHLKRIQFSAPPEMRATLHGDLRDMMRWDAFLVLAAAGGETPWGSFTNARLTSRLLPADSNGLRNAEFSLEADAVRTPWAASKAVVVKLKAADTEQTNKRFTAEVTLQTGDTHSPWADVDSVVAEIKVSNAELTTNRFAAEVTLQTGALHTPWADADSVVAELKVSNAELTTNRVPADLRLHLTTSRVNTSWAQTGPLELTAWWQQELTNQIPSSGNFDVRASGIETRWGKLAEATAKGKMQASVRTNSLAANADWGPWRWLEPYLLSVELEMDRLTTPKLTVDHAQLTANWNAPQLELTRFDARLYRGGARGTGTVDVATRKLQSSAEMDFDLQEFSPMMTTNGVRWLRQFAWNEPPRAKGVVEGVLPAWTNRQPDWRQEVLPTLRIDGEFKSGPGAFRGVPVESASSHITYSNMIWRLPDLLATRPEGVVRLEHIANDRTRDYYFKFESAIDPQALRPLVPTNQHRGFDLVQLEELPLVNGEVWGRWKRPELLGIAGTVAVSNLTFRGETGLVMRAAVQYTNLILTAHEVKVWQGDRSAVADGLEVNFPLNCLFLTNAVGNLDPMVVARAIGPKTAKALEPYHFELPPETTADGVIPLRNRNELADLRVNLRGGAFEWWKIKVPQISGTVLWQGDTLSLSDVAASFYQGTAAGNAKFDLKSEDGTRLRFQLLVTNANLNAFLADVKSGRSNVHGVVTGRLTITDAVSTNCQTWNGHGEMAMRDGLLWDVPLFGAVFSTVLNIVIPGAGLGSSRATQATATFEMTNGVVHTDDMKVGTTYMALFLRGDVSLDGKLNGRVEASLLRALPVLGRAISILFSPMTKAFEARVTGTLHEPKVEPYYGPARLLLNPFRTIKGVFEPGTETPKPVRQEKPGVPELPQQ